MVVGDLTKSWHRFGPIVEAEVRAQALAGGSAPHVRSANEDGMAHLRGAVALVRRSVSATCDAAHGLHHRVEGQLGFACAVEQQRIVRSAPDRKVVLPGIAIRDAPEGDPRDGVAMFEIHAEQGGVSLRQCLV